MTSLIRKTLELARRVLAYCREYPEDTPGFTAIVTSLTQLVERGVLLATEQRNGILEVQNATGRKDELRRALRAGPLHHLTHVAALAAKEAPELPQKFSVATGLPYFEFRTAARSMAAEAAANKEVLERHGLSETVFTQLNTLLGQFDIALDQGEASRGAHAGATLELNGVCREIRRTVKALDGLNRTRFAKDSDSLGTWQSVRKGTSQAHHAADPAPQPAPPPADERKDQPAA